MLASTFGEVSAAGTYACDNTGGSQAIIDACGARWSAANLRVHIAAQQLGTDSLTCSTKTAIALDLLAEKWIASRIVRPYQLPCGKLPAMATTDDGLLKAACREVRWSYDNQGKPNCDTGLQRLGSGSKETASKASRIAASKLVNSIASKVNEEHAPIVTFSSLTWGSNNNSTRKTLETLAFAFERQTPEQNGLVSEVYSGWLNNLKVEVFCSYTLENELASVDVALPSDSLSIRDALNAKYGQGNCDRSFATGINCFWTDRTKNSLNLLSSTGDSGELIYKGPLYARWRSEANGEVKTRDAGKL